MKGTSAMNLAAVVFLAASLGSGWAFAGCDDANPTNCPPKPTCPPTCDAAGIGVSATPTPKARRATRLPGGSGGWLVLTLRTVAGAIRAI